MVLPIVVPPIRRKLGIAAENDRPKDISKSYNISLSILDLTVFSDRLRYFYAPRKDHFKSLCVPRRKEERKGQIERKRKAKKKLVKRIKRTSFVHTSKLQTT
jgi:hypothetical protein